MRFERRNSAFGSSFFLVGVSGHRPLRTAKEIVKMAKWCSKYLGMFNIDSKMRDILQPEC